jgi:chromosome segregation ATPase
MKEFPDNMEFWLLCGIAAVAASNQLFVLFRNFKGNIIHATKQEHDEMKMEVGKRLADLEDDIDAVEERLLRKIDDHEIRHNKSIALMTEKIDDMRTAVSNEIRHEYKGNVRRWEIFKDEISLINNSVAKLSTELQSIDKIFADLRDRNNELAHNISEMNTKIANIAGKLNT